MKSKRPVYSLNPRVLTIAIPFTTSSTVEVSGDWVTIGSIHRVDVIRLTSDSSEDSIFVGFEGIPKSNNVKLPSGLPVVLQGKFPVPPNTDTVFTIASFREREAHIRNDITLKFFTQAGAAHSHTGVLYLNIYAAEIFDS